MDHTCRMTSNLDTNKPANHDRKVAARYALEFWPGIIGYILVLTAVLIWGDLDGTNPWRFVWAVLPVLPTLWIVWAVIRHIRRIDDYQRFLLLQGFGVGFAAAMIASITLGFLAIAGLDMHDAGWIIYGVGMIGWVVGRAIAGRR
jgi:hypothetical protein